MVEVHGPVAGIARVVPRLPLTYGAVILKSCALKVQTVVVLLGAVYTHFFNPFVAVKASAPATIAITSTELNMIFTLFIKNVAFLKKI